MFGLSGEHLLILAGILLIFGPRKLPELGSSIGRALRNFKEGLNNPPTSGTLESKNPENIAAVFDAQKLPVEPPSTTLGTDLSATNVQSAESQSATTSARSSTTTSPTNPS